jgi:2-polyprenyl-3-methyl-5-hydroxy-6-metoxy-1,4-benzoquinol methylase
MTHKGKVLETSGKYKIIDCVKCGFIHANPIPSVEELDEFYNKSFYQEVKPDYLEKTKKELIYWQMTYQDKMDVFNKNIKKNNKRILDIGCSGGFFPKYFQDRGWDAVGIEPSPVAAKYARKMGVNVIEELFEEVDLKTTGKFDVVHMAFVLEHVRDPLALLKRAYQMLNKGGMICIESPNDFNPLQAVLKEKLKKKPYWVCLLDHINYFTPGSLSRTLKKVGYKPQKLSGTFPMEFFVLMGEDYIGNDTVGRACHQKRMSLELNLLNGGKNDLKNKIYEDMIRSGIGREIIIYAKK